MKQQIEWVPISTPIPYENNPRKNEKAIDTVAKSIQEFGFQNPIIVDKDNVIIAGHTRLQAAIKLGLKEVPIIRAPNLTEAQVKAFRIMDNKSGENARWELDLLRKEMEALQKLEYDLANTGLKESELKRLMNQNPETNIGGKKPKYKISPGDMYQLGEHKLLCGDSTKPDSFERLMGKECATLCYTDPPYGVSYSGINNPNGRDWDVIEGDNMMGEELFEMLYRCFKQINQNLAKNGALYVFHSNLNQMILEQALNKSGFKMKQILIWNKNFKLGREHYHWCHEPIFYGCRIKEQPSFYGDRINKTTLNKLEPEKMTPPELRSFIKRIQKESSIWEFKRDSTKDYIHPTQKPVDMAERAIVNSSQAGEVIIEPFAGSGSTLMACEHRKRKCRAIEMDPVFCSHIIERWEKLTGKLGVKVARTFENDKK